MKLYSRMPSGILTVIAVLGLLLSAACAGAVGQNMPNAGSSAAGSNPFGPTEAAGGQPGGSSAAGNLPSDSSQIPGGGPSETSPQPGQIVGGGGPGNGAISGTPQPGLPPEILAFRPLDGSQVCPTPVISLQVRVTPELLNQAGSINLSMISLTVDGQDVTQQITVLTTMNYPPSLLTLNYKPTAALSVGAHRVVFTYPTLPAGPTPVGPIAGSRGTLAWTFVVANIACQ